MGHLLGSQFSTRRQAPLLCTRPLPSPCRGSCLGRRKTGLRSVCAERAVPQPHPSPRKVPAVIRFPLFMLALCVDHSLAFVFQISGKR